MSRLDNLFETLRQDTTGQDWLATCYDGATITVYGASEGVDGTLVYALAIEEDGDAFSVTETASSRYSASDGNGIGTTLARATAWLSQESGGTGERLHTTPMGCSAQGVDRRGDD